MAALMLVLLMTLAFSYLAAAAGPPTFDIRWFTIDGGGGVSGGGQFAVTGTIGQPDAGAMTGRNFTLTGGFWAGAALVPFPGDCDYNGNVNLDDFVEFDACLSGPGNGLGLGCECVDFDNDTDVDLLDFAQFQVSFDP